jgi:hypothetical protein
MGRHRALPGVCAIALAGSCLGGCQTSASLAQSSTDFVDAANALATAESSYFDEIQAASDAGHQLRAIADYTGRNGSFATIRAEFAARDDFGPAKAARMKVMDQLKAYAAEITAIQSGSSATWIADDAKATTASLNKDAPAVGAKALSAADLGIVQTIVTDLGQAIVSNASAGQLQDLARKSAAPLAQIHKMVDQDNANIEADTFASKLVSDQTDALWDALHLIYDDRGSGAAERFRAAMSVLNAKPALITQGKAIAEAVGKLEKANDALAKAPDQSAFALARQAFVLAQNASKSK